MPPNRSTRLSLRAPAQPRRGRPASPRCRGGVSSVLRVAQPAPPQRLPRALGRDAWADIDDADANADSALLPVTGPLGEFRALGGTMRACR